MNIQTVDYLSPQAGQDFVDSLHETGFAVLKNHPISGDALRNIYKHWGDFFNSDEKLEFLYDPENRDGTQQGYHPTEVSETAVGHTVKDLKEYFHVVPGCRVPPALEEEIFAYRQGALELGRELSGWLQEFAPAEVTSGIPEPFTDMLSSEASFAATAALSAASWRRAAQRGAGCSPRRHQPDYAAAGCRTARTAGKGQTRQLGGRCQCARRIGGQQRRHA